MFIGGYKRIKKNEEKFRQAVVKDSLLAESWRPHAHA